MNDHSHSLAPKKFHRPEKISAINFWELKQDEIEELLNPLRRAASDRGLSDDARRCSADLLDVFGTIESVLVLRAGNQNEGAYVKSLVALVCLERLFKSRASEAIQQLQTETNQGRGLALSQSIQEFLSRHEEYQQSQSSIQLG